MRTSFLLLILSLNLNTNAFSQFFAPDSSFGNNGLLDLGDPAVFVNYTSSALQSGERIILVESHADSSLANPIVQVRIRRFSDNGTQDMSFGQNGQVFLDTSGGILGIGPICISPIDEIFMAVSVDTLVLGNGDFAIMKFDSLGFADPSFGVNGISIVDFGGTDYISALKLDPDGRLLLGGGSMDPISLVTKMAIARLLPSGIPDPGFGNQGVQVFQPFSYSAVIDFEILPDGHIMTVGNAQDTLISDSWFVAFSKVDSAGQIDPTFGFGGVSFHRSPKDLNILGFKSALSPGGEFHFCGRWDEASFEPIVMRVNSNTGAPDSTYGEHGIAKIDSFSSFEFNTGFTDLGFMPDGSLIAVGIRAGFNIREEMLVAKFDPQGALDSSFLTSEDYFHSNFSGKRDFVSPSLLILDQERFMVLGPMSKLNPMLFFDPYMARFSTYMISGQEAVSQDSERDLLLFPNPSSETLNFRYSGTLSDEYSVSVLNSLGEPVLMATFGQDFGSIDVSNFSAGIYFFKIQSQSGERVKKILIE